MTIFTPSGLKIRLPADYSFALMQRLYPSVDAFKILKTTEVFELLPDAISFIAVIICFFCQCNPIWIAGTVAVARILGFFLCISGLPINTVFLRIGAIFRLFYGYGLYLIILGIVGFFFVGWQGLAAYVAGRIIAGIMNGIAGHFNGNRIQKQLGKYITMSEANFLNAYTYHARRKNKPLDLGVSDQELEASNWQPAFTDLATKCPQIVTRVTNDWN